MSQKPPTRATRENPDIDQLKRQAKELLEAYRASAAEAVAEVAPYYRDADPETFALHDAQFVLARSYGFESWPKPKAAVDGVTATKVNEAVESANLNTVRELLTRRPEIVDQGRGMSPLILAVQRRDHFDNINADRVRHSLVRRLERLGHVVTLQPAVLSA